MLGGKRGIVGWLLDLLGGETKYGLAVSRFVRVDVKPDRLGIQRAAQANEIRAADLKRLNLRLEEDPPPTVTVDPAPAGAAG